jgi:hypothetical protein
MTNVISLRAKAVKKVTRPDLIGDLPFVAKRAEQKEDEFPRCFWVVKGTGDWEADCKLGTVLGLMCLKVMREDRFTPLLGWIAHDQKRAGQFDGVQAGFWDAIAAAAIR